MADYVIIGNGVAGTTAAENIRKLDPKGSITILTDEDLPFYYRIRLTDYISGELAEHDLLAKKERWFEDNNIELIVKTRVMGADPKEKIVFTGDKQKHSYGTLLLATGSHSFIPPINGSEKSGVFALRNIQDARTISVWTNEVDDSVLIGGGLLGLEAGNALRKLGRKVTVVEFFPRLLPRQLDTEGAKLLQETMEDMGFFFRLGAKTQEITGNSRVAGVILEGGEVIPAGMVLISAGVRPNLELAEPLGLEIDKGIKVNELLQTNQPYVYAAGDVAEFRGVPYGIWPAAMEQGKIAGSNMAGENMTYNGTTMVNTLKVVGIDLASAGNIDADDEFESKLVKGKGIYKKIVLNEGEIIGCIMLGDTGGFNKVTRAMARGQDVHEIGDLLFSLGFNF